MGFYNDRVLAKFKDAYHDASRQISNGKRHVTISKSNIKMGAVASVSTLPFLTCPGRCKETCGEKCYAAKLANLRPSVLKSYALNTALAANDPDTYWNDINAACKKYPYFRFHVSGDIMSADYFRRMIQCAEQNPKTEMLAFTKRYEIVNNYLRSGKTIPSNLHILFSGWTNLRPVNPYHLPETNVVEHGKDPHPEWTMCGGNCFHCANVHGGCWAATNGEVIGFHMH